MKTCITCKQDKPDDAYYKDSKHSDRLRGSCIECMAAQNKTWRKENPEKERASGRTWRKNNHTRQRQTEKSRELKKKYGLTIEDYEAIMMAQNHKCAICRTPLIMYGSMIGKTAVDHNHANGQVRGILCWHCNCALGSMRDNVEIAKSCVEYLEMDGAFNLQTIHEKVAAMKGGQYSYASRQP